MNPLDTQPIAPVGTVTVRGTPHKAESKPTPPKAKAKARPRKPAQRVTKATPLQAEVALSLAQIYLTLNDGKKIPIVGFDKKGQKHKAMVPSSHKLGILYSYGYMLERIKEFI